MVQQNWLRSISIDEWNELLNAQTLSVLKDIPDIKNSDKICFYVRGTSNVKGIATLDDGKIQFNKIGNGNYFGITQNLKFVGDKDDVVKYLKNYGGLANFGKPIPPDDIDFISEYLIPDKETESRLEPEVPLKNEFQPGTSYEKMFDLENILRTFIVEKLSSVSTNWLKERAPDREAVKKWEERKNDAKKMDKWFGGNDNDIIQFTDFPDLLTLIISRKNWKDCFETVFLQKTIFEGKMIELSKIRNDIAHNRSLSQDQIDALALYSRQLLKLINPNN